MHRVEGPRRAVADIRMMKRGVAVLLLSLMLPLAAASPASAGKRCGSNFDAFPGLWKIRAHGVGCQTAREVGFAIRGGMEGGRNFPRRVSAFGKRYRCSYRRVTSMDSTYYRTTCRRGSRLVRINLTS